jgi:hypothetical protein
MRGGARGAETPTCHHVKTLAATSSSRPNPKALAAREVLAHPHTVFHPDAAMIAAVLIGYDDMEVATGMTTRKRRS